MVKYKGRCIGGVADGHYIERDDVEIKIQAMKKAPFGELDAGLLKDIELDYTIYKFLWLLRNNNIDIGVWVPSHQPIEAVIERLINCYDPYAKLIGRQKQKPLPIKQG